MKKLLLLLTVFFTIGFAQAQLVGDTFVDGLYNFEVVTAATEVIFPKRTASASLALSGAITLPSTATDGNGITYNVVGTGESSFNGLYIDEIQNDVTSIAIPNTYTSIGFRTFRNAENVQSYTLEEGLITIEGQAFYNNWALTSIVIPNTVTAMGGSVLQLCTSLTSVTLSQSLLQIPDRMVMQSPGVTSLSIPASVTDFLENSFLTTSVTTLIMEGATPPVINAGWAGSTANITVYTDAANIAAYEAAPIWADMEIKDLLTLSTNKVDQELAWSIYPNPTSGLVSIQNKKLISADVTVYDLNGRTVLTKSINNAETQVDISNLTSGLYIFNVESQNGSFSRRVIKQ